MNWLTSLFIGPDNRINGTEGNTVNDTGLYELYKNVVEKFIDKMIKEAERYAGTEPADAWRSRNNYGPKGCKKTTPPSCVDEHGPGMSYSFGGNADIKTFNQTVSLWQAPPNAVYTTNEIPADYRGNIDDRDGRVDDRADDGDPVGNRKWAGLYEPEWNIWNRYFKNTTNVCDANTGANQREHRLYPHHWAGIDCSAFVQRVINSADPAVNKDIDDLPAVKTTIFDLNQYAENCTTRNLDNRAYVGYYFHKETKADAKRRTYFVPMATDDDREEFTPRLRRGDLIRYNGHVSIVHSTKPVCTTNADGQTTCTYEIVHAYGVDRADLDRDGVANEFTRKVVISPNRLLLPNRTWSLSNPTGFGRIKLWD